MNDLALSLGYVALAILSLFAVGWVLVRVLGVLERPLTRAASPINRAIRDALERRDYRRAGHTDHPPRAPFEPSCPRCMQILSEVKARSRT